MTEMMLRFCEAYLANGKTNAAQAYRDAGYKCANDHAAAAGAQNLLTKIDIQEYLESHAENLRIKAEHEHRLMTAEELAQWFCDVASGRILDNDELPKMSDRLKAAELYGKYLNVFSANVNVKTAEPIVIRNNVTE